MPSSWPLGGMQYPDNDSDNDNDNGNGNDSGKDNDDDNDSGNDRPWPVGMNPQFIHQFSSRNPDARPVTITSGGRPMSNFVRILCLVDISWFNYPSFRSQDKTTSTQVPHWWKWCHRYSKISWKMSESYTKGYFVDLVAFETSCRRGVINKSCQ